jgi:hypothetical protein
MRKLLTTIVAGLAVAIAGASGAQAQSSPIDQIIRQEDSKGVAAVSVSAPAVRPDDRAGPLGVGRDAVVSEPGTSLRPDDRPGPLGIGLVEPIQVVGPGDGFDWGDAGLGAGAALALALLAAGGFARRRQMAYEATQS